MAEAAYQGAKRLPADEPGLQAEAAFDPGRELWPFGAHVGVVQIDQDTGAVHLRKIVAVDDCGTVVNPLIAEGQIQGGIAQGVGQALLERVQFDAGGQLLSSSLGD